MTKKQILLKLSAYKVFVALAAVSLVLGGLILVKAYNGEASVVVEGDYIEAPVVETQMPTAPMIGALSGPDVYSYLKVHGRFQQGGYMGTDAATSTTSTTDIITATQVWTYSGLDYTPGDAAMSITLPASSTLSFLYSPGDCIDWRFRNVDATSATSTTIVAGTGIDLVEYTGGDVVIEGGNEALLRFCRELDTDVTVYVSEFIAA